MPRGVRPGTGTPSQGEEGIDAYIYKKNDTRIWMSFSIKVAMTYSPTNLCSTIGAVGLNFSVRDGKRWNPNAINRLNKGPIFHIVTQIKVNLLIKQTIHILITYETSIAWMYRSMLMAQARTFSLARKKSFRAIRTARLNMLPCLHLQPINVVVYDDPYEEI